MGYSTNWNIQVPLKLVDRVVYRAKTGKIIFHGDVHIEPLSWGRGDPDSNTLNIKI